MWIKICGVTRLEDARDIAAAQPDAIGLNFYSRSGRFVAPETAARIVKEIPPGILPVGVFVNHSVTEIRDICQACKLTTIQLHGDETPDLASQLPELKIIRAFRVGVGHEAALRADVTSWQELIPGLMAGLADAKVDGEFGGTGRVAPWELLNSTWREDWPKLVLAGGLHPGNVASAIRAVRPWGVDVAGGVESAPGVKNSDAVRDFIQQARAVNSVEH